MLSNVLLQGGITLRCIFCKQDSAQSKSVEHIVPESLGGKISVLPRGIVCDKCNNYFARKVEFPFFEFSEIQTLRFHEGLPNKRGKVPFIGGVLGERQVKVFRSVSGVSFPNTEEVLIVEYGSKDSSSPHRSKTEPLPLRSSDIIDRRIIFPALTNDFCIPNSTTTSRFLAKMALEALAARTIETPDWEDFIIDNPSLDPLRDYARYGNRSKVPWPCSIRRIYDLDAHFQGEDGQIYQKLNEWDILLIPAEQNEQHSFNDILPAYAFLIFALFGLEFVINIAGPDEDGLKPYEDWLKVHNGISPLYYGKNLTSLRK